MSSDERGQLTATAATVYEDFFVPALFDQWALTMTAAAGVGPGDTALDVACGTGVLTRAVAAAVGPSGRVVGLDLNEGMLDVARRRAPSIEWVAGSAESLPFDDASFDAAVSQFGLMFFTDRARSLAEMRRVVRPGGAVAVAVWGPLRESPGYLALAELLEQLFGAAAADALRWPFSMGDGGELRALLDDTGLASIDVVDQAGAARFPSLDSWMFTEVRGWTLADQIDDEAFDRLLREARRTLGQFQHRDGTVEFAVHALVARGIARA